MLWKERGVIGRAMGWKRKAATNYCRLRGGKGIRSWWITRCGEEEETPDHIVFRCRKIKRMKYAKGRGRREWVRENGMKWDSWDELASRNERVDLMEEFFEIIHCL